jgi:hypothetical protein
MQRLFVENYIGISNGNATDAARRAGYASPNVQGPRLLVNVGIRAAVQERYKQAAMTADEALYRLRGMAAASLADAFTDDLAPEFDEWGNPVCYHAETGKPIGTRPVKRISIEKLHETGLIHYVKKISANQFGPIIELNDPQGAIDKILRAHGVYKDEGAVPQIIIKNYRGVEMEAV